MKNIQRYHVIKISNDMIILLRFYPKVSKSLAAVILAVGTMKSPDQQLGLVHYLEQG
ncbi:MAG: hypothetical protein ACTS73_04525 [Arsenophonus sp. NEOnobi-MAG3]